MEHFCGSGSAATPTTTPSFSPPKKPPCSPCRREKPLLPLIPPPATRHPLRPLRGSPFHIPLLSFRFFLPPPSAISPRSPVKCAAYFTGPSSAASRPPPLLNPQGCKIFSHPPLNSSKPPFMPIPHTSSLLHSHTPEKKSLNTPCLMRIQVNSPNSPYTPIDPNDTPLAIPFSSPRVQHPMLHDLPSAFHFPACIPPPHPTPQFMPLT
jgi:hypothetical protein